MSFLLPILTFTLAASCARKEEPTAPAPALPSSESDSLYQSLVAISSEASIPVPADKLKSVAEQASRRGWKTATLEMIKEKLHTAATSLPYVANGYNVEVDPRDMSPVSFVAYGSFRNTSDAQCFKINLAANMTVVDAQTVGDMVNHEIWHALETAYLRSQFGLG
jgi:hypothetical protein